MKNRNTLEMKNIFYTLVLVAAGLITSCSGSDSDTFVLEGEIKNTSSDQVSLETVGVTDFVTVDTTKIVNGKFKFQRDIGEGLYRIRTQDMSSALYLYGKNGDKVNVQVEANDLGNYQIQGNRESEQLRELTSMAMGQRTQRKVWRKSIDDYRGERKDSIQALIDGSIIDQDDQIMEYIDKADDVELAAFAIQLLTDLQGKMDYVEETLADLKNKDPNSEYVNALSEKMANYKKIYQEAALKAATREGGTAPEIALPNPQDEIMKLTELRGKVVLLDFWASWCRPCRRENPRVVAAYNKYKDQGFDVFSVSLDRSKDKWVRAIEHDNLIWEGHVSDLKHWRSEAAKLYKVGSIPATFLLDREGKVIAKNLRGPALDRKLEEIFGS